MIISIDSCAGHSIWKATVIEFGSLQGPATHPLKRWCRTKGIKSAGTSLPDLVHALLHRTTYEAARPPPPSHYVMQIQKLDDIRCRRYSYLYLSLLLCPGINAWCQGRCPIHAQMCPFWRLELDVRHNRELVVRVSWRLVRVVRSAFVLHPAINSIKSSETHGELVTPPAVLPSYAIPARGDVNVGR